LQRVLELTLDSPAVAEASPDRPCANRAMDRYADGDDGAFSALYDVLAPRLYVFLFRQTRDRAGAEDLLQQTLLQIHCARSSFVRGAEVFPWAFSIARRLLIDAYRRGRYSEMLLDDDHPTGDRPSQDALPDAVLQSKQVAEHIERALMKLPESQRIAFLLVRIEGLSLLEVAAVLGTTPNAVKLRVLRTSDALRHAIFERGGCQ